MRFWSRGKPEEVTTPPVDPTSGKGRPTPTRKEAEAARKQSLKVPSDAKEARRAARTRAARERQVTREALMSGDERALPARDAGPVRRHVRDFVDRRFAAAEIFLPFAVVVLLVGFIRVPEVQGIVSLLWLVVTIFIVFDTTLLLTRLDRSLKAQWPDKADRKGALFYGLMRVLQLRKLRLPPPKVRIGGRPVVPKKPKGRPAGDAE